MDPLAGLYERASSVAGGIVVQWSENPAQFAPRIGAAVIPPAIDYRRQVVVCQPRDAQAAQRAIKDGQPYPVSLYDRDNDARRPGIDRDERSAGPRFDELGKTPGRKAPRKR